MKWLATETWTGLGGPRKVGEHPELGTAGSQWPQRTECDRREGFPRVKWDLGLWRWETVSPLGSREINTLTSLCFHLPTSCWCLLSAQPNQKSRSRERPGDSVLSSQPPRTQSMMEKEGSRCWQMDRSQNHSASVTEIWEIRLGYLEKGEMVIWGKGTDFWKPTLYLPWVEYP